MLCSRPLLPIYFIYCSVYVLLLIYPSLLPLWQPVKLIFLSYYPKVFVECCTASQRKQVN